MKYGYIYLTENILNGRIYIGQRKGLFCSWYLGSGKILEKAIQKDGKNNFRINIVAYAKDKEELDKYEIKLISIYRKRGANLYNIADGGQNNPHLYQTGRTRFKKGMTPWNKGKKVQSNTGRTHFVKGSHISDTHKKRIGIATRGDKNPFYGKKHTPEALEKMSKTWFKKKD